MTPDFTALMAELESLGTAQARKIYANHGASEPMFGVSFANFTALKKKLKTNQPLSEALWNTGILDARVLGCMIADPNAISREMAEQWTAESRDYMAGDELANLLAKTPFARELADQWRNRYDSELFSRMGWNLITRLAMAANDLPDEYFIELLAEIETTIHSAPNRTRDAQNMAMIAIGSRNEMLHYAGLDAAKRVGKVVVDFGDTSCKTPDALSYMPKAYERQMKKQKVK